MKRYFKATYYLDKDELKREYRRLARQFHPDKGGNTEIMAVINLEYEQLKKKQCAYSPRQKRAEPPPRMSKKDSIIINLKSMELPFWVESNTIFVGSGSRTYENRETLKAYGFWWDSVAKVWYWQDGLTNRKRGYGT